MKNDRGLLIPDKYNTGPDPNVKLTKVKAGGPDETFSVGEIKFVRADRYGAGHILLDNYYFQNAPAEVTVENFDFSEYYIDFVDYHQLEKDRTLIFKNCKFGNFNAYRVFNEHAKLEFYDCEFTSAHGSHMKFERCKFHVFKGDAMNPFQDVDVKDSFYDIIGHPDSEGSHLDGFQIFGREEHRLQERKN